MLPLSYRLPRSSFVNPQTKQIYRSKNFILITIPQPVKDDISLSRFAVSISKRFDKRATRRNRTKRLVLAAIQSLLPQTKIGFDCRLSIRTIFWKEKLNDILPEVKQAFIKAGLLQV